MTDDLLKAAREGFAQAPPLGDARYARYTRELAARLHEARPRLADAADADAIDAERRSLPASTLGLLRMTEQEYDRLAALAEEVHDLLPHVCRSGDPVPMAGWGQLRSVPRPLGVVLMVHEARPWLTFEAALLPAALGNAVVVHGGTEARCTNAVLADVVKAALGAAGLPADLVTFADADRRTLRSLLARRDAITAVLPRESRALIDYCRNSSAVPVIASGRGFNHLYVHRSADPATAAAVALDSKVPNPVMCNSLQLALVDAEVADAFVDALTGAAARGGGPVTLRLDPTLGREPGELPGCRIEQLADHDLGREFLDATVGVLVVDGAESAIEHIHRHGSAHTEGVVTTDPAVAEDFTRRVDAAAVIVNGSLRLHDAPTLGMGPELTLSSGRMHARGPVTLRSLLTHSWVVEGNGTLRSDID
ncbi:glutamate-5-semialdehyde dehydrogenase [Streptomyces sp. NPDC002536]